jgi:hypothetical protein
MPRPGGCGIVFLRPNNANDHAAEHPRDELENHFRLSAHDIVGTLNLPK